MPDNNDMNNDKDDTKSFQRSSNSEDHLNLLNQALPFGIWERDFSSQELHWSPGQERLMGFEPGTFPGTFPDFLSLVHPDSLPVLRTAQQKALESDGRYKAELKFQLRDGRIRWGETRGQIVFDEERRPVRIIGVEIDITERKQAQLALSQARDWHNRVAGTLPGAVISFRMSGDGTPSFPYGSPEVKDFYGLTPEDLKKNAWRMRELIHPDDVDRLKSSVRHSAATLQPWHQEFRLIHPDRGEIWVEARTIPQTETDGGTLWVGILLDISDRVKAQEVLRQVQKMEAVGQLAGGIAHDFNNLLTIILGCSEMLKSELPPSHTAQELIEEIRAAGVRAAGLTRQLLTFSRRQVMKPTVMDLNQIVNAATRILRSVVGEDISLAVDLCSEPLPVRVDSLHLDQVLLNIVVNARDAMPDGGEVRISTDSLMLAPSAVGSMPEDRAGSYARISVTDTGHGITPEVRTKMFDPFFTTRDPGQGSGLGLSVVHGIIQQSGGYVEVSSEPGLSTTISVLLPLWKRSSIMPGPSPATFAPSAGVETILLVEDDVAVRELSCRALSACGYSVLTAGNGQEAMQLWRRFSGDIHLLATDVVLPLIGGRKLAETIHQQDPGVRILFISGHSADAVTRHGIHQHQVEFLQKPYTPEDLCLKVRQVLDG